MKLKRTLASILLPFCLVFVSGCFRQGYEPKIMVDEYEIYTFVIPLGKYDNILDVSYGMASVERNRRGVELLNIATGEYVVPFGRYSAVTAIYYNRALARNRNGSGIIDIVTGEQIVPFGKYVIRPTQSRMALVYVEDATIYHRSVARLAEAMIDIESGKYIIPFGRYWVWGAYDNMAIVQSLYGEVALLDIENHDYVIAFGEFDSIRENINNNMAIVSALFNRLAIIDIETREELIPFGMYVHFNRMCSGLVVAQTEEGTRVIIDILSNEDITPFDAEEYRIWDISDGMVIFGSDVKWAVKDISSGEVIIPFFRYTSIHRTDYDSTFIVTRRGQSGVIYIN